MSTLIYEKKDSIATVTFNRPQSRNALTPEMLCRFADAVIDFKQDDQLRVLILTGAGDQAFCAGGDLGSTLPLMTGARPAMDQWDKRLLDDPTVLAASSLREFELHKPVISAINGACFAAGFEMMLGTDIRVAAHHATFALPEVKRAVIPFAGSIVRLPRQISYCQAMEFLLTGESMTAEKAVTIGLVNYAVPAAEVMGKAIQIAQRIALNGPLAVQRVKQTAIQASGMTLSAGYRLEDESKRIVFESDDAKEGPLAFMQKRSPIYSGR